MNVIEKHRPENKPSFWEYRIKGDRQKYEFSLPDFRRDFREYKAMSDVAFIHSLPDALHYACIVAYYKNLSAEETLLDTGVIHELVHLHTDTFYVLDKLNTDKDLRGIRRQIKSVRAKFEKYLKV